MSGMLQSEVSERWSLEQVLSSAWMNYGYSEPVESLVPFREPVSLPLDPVVMNEFPLFVDCSVNGTTQVLTDAMETVMYRNAVEEFRTLQKAMKTEPLILALPVLAPKRGLLDRLMGNAEVKSAAPSSAGPDFFKLLAKHYSSSAADLALYYLIRERMKRDAKMLKTS